MRKPHKRTTHGHELGRFKTIGIPLHHHARTRINNYICMGTTTEISDFTWLVDVFKIGIKNSEKLNYKSIDQRFELDVK